MDNLRRNSVLVTKGSQRVNKKYSLPHMAIGYPNLKKEKLEMPDKKENIQTKSCRLVLSSEG